MIKIKKGYPVMRQPLFLSGEYVKLACKYLEDKKSNFRRSMELALDI
jgi:hypothetical protein